MQGFARTVPWLLGCCLVTGATRAEVDPAVLLAQVTPATKSLNYEGTFIYAHGRDVDAMRIVHKAEHGVEYERLKSLTGPAREVVRDGTRVTCTFADDREVMVEKRRPQDFIGLALSEPVDKIRQYYDFELLADGRIAERNAKVVLVRPRMPDRYSYQLWVDERTNLLLKSAVLGQGGQVLEQVMFIDIEIGHAIDDAKLTAELDGAGFTWRTNEAESAEAPGADTMALNVQWVPAGFALRNSHTRPLVSSRAPVRHAVYSDGLAMFSVFIEEISQEQPPLQGYSSMGAINAFSRMYDRYQVTVVGEVPQSTVRRIAASVAIQ